MPWSLIGIREESDVVTPGCEPPYVGGIASNVLAIGSYAKLPYDPRGDFTFIGGMWQLPNILTARRDLFSSDLKELLAAFKKEPRKYTYASAGFGTTLHLSGEMMNSMAGVEVTHIPYKGAGPALTDLLGGRVDLLFDNLPGSLPSVRAGQVKPVAVTAKTRIAELPDVPAFAEVLPGYEMEIKAFRDSEEARLLPVLKASGIKPE
jgi:tripartite-type tricarboxylate transporter receptor subunit TctC